MTCVIATQEIVDAPLGGEDIDVDRIVWDPAYRSAAISILARHHQPTGSAEAGSRSAKQVRG